MYQFALSVFNLPGRQPETVLATFGPFGWISVLGLVDNFELQEEARV